MKDGAKTDDGDLVASAKGGDTDAFAELLNRYSQRVYMTAYHILRNPDDALDVTQDAYVRAWKSMSNFEGPGSFGAWVSRIASNAAIDIVRRRTAHPNAEMGDGPMHIDAASRTTPKAAEAPGDAHDRAAMKAAFDRALDLLSPEHRAVILLKEVEDLSYKEIADQIGCSAGTVMSRLFYARKKLQEELRGFYDDL